MGSLSSSRSNLSSNNLSSNNPSNDSPSDNGLSSYPSSGQCRRPHRRLYSNLCVIDRYNHGHFYHHLHRCKAIIKARSEYLCKAPYAALYRVLCAACKVLCVALGDPHQQHIERLEQVRPHRLVEIEHFFETYKMLENKSVDVVGWRELDRALEVLTDDRERFAKQHGG